MWIAARKVLNSGELNAGELGGRILSVGRWPAGSVSANSPLLIRFELLISLETFLFDHACSLSAALVSFDSHFIFPVRSAHLYVHSSLLAPVSGRWNGVHGMDNKTRALADEVIRINHLKGNGGLVV